LASGASRPSREEEFSPQRHRGHRENGKAKSRRVTKETAR
jgi:hypothetical protein